jgi:diphthamide synthase subunit DPH2
MTIEQEMALKEEIDHFFTYHAPTDEQRQRYQAIRDKAKELAFVILTNTLRGSDQSAAMRKLRECVMTANASIALEKPF